MNIHSVNPILRSWTWRRGLFGCRWKPSHGLLEEKQCLWRCRATHCNTIEDVDPKIFRALGRMGGRAARSNKYVNAGITAAQVTAKATARASHILWLEITGFLFSVLAVVLAAATMREYHRYTLGASVAGRVAVTAFFTLIFAYFGATSFYRSRRVR